MFHSLISTYLILKKGNIYGVITTKWIDNRKLKTQWSLNSILEIKRIDEDFIVFVFNNNTYKLLRKNIKYFSVQLIQSGCPFKENLVREINLMTTC